MRYCGERGRCAYTGMMLAQDAWILNAFIFFTYAHASLMYNYSLSLYIYSLEEGPPLAAYSCIASRVLLPGGRRWGLFRHPVVPFWHPRGPQAVGHSFWLGHFCQGVCFWSFLRTKRCRGGAKVTTPGRLWVISEIPWADPMNLKLREQTRL